MTERWRRRSRWRGRARAGARRPAWREVREQGNGEATGKRLGRPMPEASMGRRGAAARRELEVRVVGEEKGTSRGERMGSRGGADAPEERRHGCGEDTTTGGRRSSGGEEIKRRKEKEKKKRKGERKEREKKRKNQGWKGRFAKTENGERVAAKMQGVGKENSQGQD